jgi:hypothetical protein
MNISKNGCVLNCHAIITTNPTYQNILKIFYEKKWKFVKL